MAAPLSEDLVEEAMMQNLEVAARQSFLNTLNGYRALVLDSSYRPIDVVNWQRAICLDLFEKARSMTTPLLHSTCQFGQCYVVHECEAAIVHGTAYPLLEVASQMVIMPASVHCNCRHLLMFPVSQWQASSMGTRF